MRRRDALLALAVAAASLACEREPRAMVTTTLHVEGMVCDSCEQAIAAEVAKLPGVESCEADHVAKSAVVRHDPAEASVDAIAAAIEKLGYTVVR